MAETCPFCLQPDTKIYLTAKEGILRKCRRCHCVFNPQRANEFDADSEELNTGYNALIEKMAGLDAQIGKKIANFMAAHLEMSGNFLEIGCGTCFLSKVFRENYPRIRYTGIESSSKFFDALSHELKKQVFFDKDLSAALDRIPDHSQNAIILNHVLEHLPDPRATMLELKKKLSENGGIYLEVPNEQWKKAQIMVRNILKPNAPAWFAGHINFFTKENLGHFLDHCGFRVAALKRESIADNQATFIKMLGGEEVYRDNRLAQFAYHLLRLTAFEKLIRYGIVLRCICKKN